MDGRILMPATSYVVTAWEALASELGTEARQLPATLEGVRIHQAVVATEGQKITLEVQLAPGNRFFVRPKAYAAQKICASSNLRK